MTIRSTIKRAATVGGATTALVLAGSMSASAHHCFIPMYSLNAPTSGNWEAITAENGAEMFGIFDTTCDAQRDAGYSALREAGLPVGIKLFGKMTIGEGNNFAELFEDPEYFGPSGSGQGSAHNPNGANGKGLEYFGAGSTVPDEMLLTYAGAASAESCE